MSSYTDELRTFNDSETVRDDGYEFTPYTLRGEPRRPTVPLTRAGAAILWIMLACVVLAGMVGVVQWNNAPSRDRARAVRMSR